MQTEEAQHYIYMCLSNEGENFELHKHTLALKRQQNTSTKGKNGAGSTNADSRVWKKMPTVINQERQTTAAPLFCSQVYNSKSQPEEKYGSVWEEK